MSNKNSYLTVTSPLDEDKPFFQIHHFEGVEELCKSFEYLLTLSSSKPVDFSKIIGKKMTISIEIGKDSEKRYVNGNVTRMAEINLLIDPAEKEHYHYHCELRPGLWELSLTRESRIFYDEANTTLSILSELLMEYGFDDLENTCVRKYDFRPFCVMYDESVMNFVARLLEREGIFWYWKHEESRHILVLGDNSDQLPPCVGIDVAILATQNQGWVQSDHILNLHASSQVMPGKYEVSDYNYKEPPCIDFQESMPKGKEKLTIYEHPADFSTTSGSQRRLKDRMESYESLQNQISGKGYVRSFCGGYRFAIDAPKRPEHLKEFILSKVKIVATQTSYINEFDAFPADLPYHPLANTPRPKIIGTQTAIVVGDGDKTEGDCHGAVKVHFHWDRQSAPNDPLSTCPVRVASIFAGKQRGLVFTPYIGDEVVVSFENGDPEKPLIIGSVHGPNHPMPFQRGGNPRQSMIKTSEEADSNQIKFIDKAGEEQFYINAKKDFEINVLNKNTTTIKDSSTVQVGGNQSISIGKDDSTTISGKQTLSVAKDSTQDFGENLTQTVGKEFKQSVGKDFTLTVDGSSLIIEASSGDVVIKGNTISLESTSGDVSIKSAQGLLGEAGSKVDLKSTTTVSINAGSDFLCKAKANAQTEAGAKIESKALMINSSGSTMVSIKGAIVKVN